MSAIQDDRGFNQIYEQSPVNLIRLKRRADWMIEDMDVAAGKKILEIGCGTGFVSHYIASKTGMQMIGSDLCVPFIEEARERFSLPNLSYEVLDFNDAAADASKKFDYILGNGILHHLFYHLDKTFVTLREMLSPGGKIIFMEPNIYNPYVAAIFKNKALRKWAHLEPDEMAFSASFVKDKLNRAGFRLNTVTYRDFLLPGVPHWMIGPSIAAGNLLEKTPLRIISQSIFITATNQ